MIHDTCELLFHESRRLLSRDVERDAVAPTPFPTRWSAVGLDVKIGFVAGTLAPIP